MSGSKRRHEPIGAVAHVVIKRIQPRLFRARILGCVAVLHPILHGGRVIHLIVVAYTAAGPIRPVTQPMVLVRMPQAEPVPDLVNGRLPTVDILVFAPGKRLGADQTPIEQVAVRLRDGSLVHGYSAATVRPEVLHDVEVDSAKVALVQSALELALVRLDGGRVLDPCRVDGPGAVSAVGAEGDAVRVVSGLENGNLRVDGLILGMVNGIST